MRILITGGAGFIASHLQDAYLKAGHEVAVMDNLLSGRKEQIRPETRFYPLDIRSPEAFEAIQEFQPHVLSLHAAQMDVRKSVENPRYDLEINGLGMLNLLEAARISGVKKVLFASSGGAVYGEQEAFPATESHPTQPASPYGITKLLGDKYLQFYRETYGIPFVSLRYANVYGPRQNPHGEAGVVAIFITRFLRGEIPCINGDGGQTRDYVFVGDVVRANLLALQEEVEGIFNIGTGRESSVLKIYQVLCEILGIRQEPRHGPAKAGEQRRSVISSAKLERVTGWCPQISLEEGLVETVEFFRRQMA